MIIKQLLYRSIYCINLIKYAKKKVKLQFLEVWVGQTCTLCCRDCLHLIPYIPSKIYSIEKLITDIKKMLELCEIDYISILGGEPFTNKEIDKLFDFVGKCGQIKNGKVITNGTIIPNQLTIQALKFTNKLEVHVDSYPGQETRSANFMSVMQNNGIPCVMYRYDNEEEMFWKYLGENRQKQMSVKQAKLAHKRCVMKSVYTLSNGAFTSCPRGITTKYVYDLNLNQFEHVSLSEIHNNSSGRAKIATCRTRVYKDYCRYCLGVTKDNTLSVVPGLQSNN